MTHHPLILLGMLFILWPHQVLGEEAPEKAGLAEVEKNAVKVKAPSPAGNRPGLKWSEQVQWFEWNEARFESSSTVKHIC